MALSTWGEFRPFPEADDTAAVAEEKRPAQRREAPTLDAYEGVDAMQGHDQVFDPYRGMGG
jgi:hypothetical protein